MRKLTNTLVLLATAAFAALSCYGIKDENYPELGQLEITVPSDTINTMIGEALVYDGLSVQSATGELKYEWAYGSPSSGTQIKDHKFANIEVISSSPTIDYVFNRTGSYILRLRLDNGESVIFKYFTLNVNAGFDEGYVVLSNDSGGNGSLTFIKTLTSEEAAQGRERVMPMNTFGDFKRGTDLFMSDFTDNGVTDAYGNSMLFTALLVATDDEQGTIYHVEPKTMELNMKVSLASLGTHCVEFGGEYSRVHAFTCYFRGADGLIYQYDMQSGGLNVIQEVETPQDRIYPMLTSEGSTVTRYPAFFNSEAASVRRSSSSGTKVQKQEGWEVVNMGVSRTSYSYGYVLWRNKAVPTRYKITSCGVSTWDRAGYASDVLEFDAADLKMDRSSVMLPVKKSSDLYYNYDNAIYRWGLTSQPSSVPAIVLPAGEQYRAMCSNFLGKTKSDDGEDRIAIATWNPSKSKGSVFIYSVETQTLLESFEGICDEPAAIIYKYRLN